MSVSFHLHTPPPTAMAGTIPTQYQPAEPVPYIRIESGADPINGRMVQVVDRQATPEDQRRHPKQWAAFQAEQAKKTKAPAPAEAKATETKGAGKK